VQKYLPEDRYLLRSARLKISAPDSVARAALRTQGESLLQDRLSPSWRVWWHYRQKFPLRWLGERIGREPIFFAEQSAERIQRLLEHHSHNLGHFYALATYQVDTLRQKQAVNVRYHLRVGPAYTIDTLRYYFTDSVLARRLAALRAETILKVGAPYRLASLRTERERLASELRKQGYYYFTADDLEFLADTIGNEKGVKLLLRLKPDRPTRTIRPQRIGHIRVITGGRRHSFATTDTIRYQHLELIEDHQTLRPHILAQAIAFEPGAYYRPEWHQQTIERLASFNTYRYISISYSPAPTADSILHVQILLSPALRRSAAGEVGAAYNSGRYFGPELSLKYQNRNLFRGAELLSVKGDMIYNFFLGPQEQSRIPRSGIFGLESTLEIPRFFLPKATKILPGSLEAGTYITLGGKLESLSLTLNRFAEEIEANNLNTLSEWLAQDNNATQGVNLWQFALNYGYNWKGQPAINHRLTLARVRYQNPVVQTEELLSLSRSLGFVRGLSGLGRLDRMFLMGCSYDWRYNSRQTVGFQNRNTRHHFLVELQLGLGFNTVLPVGNNERQLEREQSNYVRPIVDLRHYWEFVPNFTLATRIHTGAALPFTERAIVPYFDLFTVGGPNSLRGFLPRGLGPGITVPLNNNLLGQNGFGNVLIESSLELRWRLNEFLQFAGFVDAGNVWLYKAETEPTPGDFDFTRFRKELGVDAGGGVRIDFGFLILRLDLAWPIYIPFEVNPDTPPNRSPRLVLGFGQAF